MAAHSDAPETGVTRHHFERASALILGQVALLLAALDLTTAVTVEAYQRTPH